jgi:hypothetical protein
VAAETFTGFPAQGLAVRSGPKGAELVLTEGRDLVFPVRRTSKRAALRFAVGEPGRRGTIWRLWANSGTDDVYLASRQTAGEVKISFHQSGDWRMQIVQPDRPKTVRFGPRPDEEGRVLHRWQRPEPNAVGWIHALTIALPGQQLSVVPGDQVRWDDVRWLPSPQPHEQAEFDIHIVRPNGGMIGFQQMILEGVRVSVMDALQLSSGDVVVVTALIGPTRPAELATIARMQGRAENGLPAPQEWDRSPERGPRLLA